MTQMELQDSILLNEKLRSIGIGASQQKNLPHTDLLIPQLRVTVVVAYHHRYNPSGYASKTHGVAKSATRLVDSGYDNI